MTYWVCTASPVDSSIRRIAMPYVERLLHIDISAGTLEFNGYWYGLQRNEIQLPIQLRLSMSAYDEAAEQAARERVDACGGSIRVCAVEHYYLKIEITRHEFYEDTSVYSPYDPNDEDSGICLFPTNRQKCWFSLLEDNSEANRLNCGFMIYPTPNIADMEVVDLSGFSFWRRRSSSSDDDESIESLDDI